MKLQGFHSNENHASKMHFLNALTWYLKTEVLCALYVNGGFSKTFTDHQNIGEHTALNQQALLVCLGQF